MNQKLINVFSMGVEMYECVWISAWVFFEAGNTAPFPKKYHKNGRNLYLKILIFTKLPKIMWLIIQLLIGRYVRCDCRLWKVFGISVIGQHILFCRILIICIKFPVTPDFLFIFISFENVYFDYLLRWGWWWLMSL